ncbi:sulfur acquisition oxidoreductase, SfnB family [Thermomonospora echinospora]|uniref:Sulfur acquisition oxidoreductase, SfnB family n=1 Tax=Thermomonospora echinospora TaxID=1992 RepID=A0A1H6B0H8_9ACTN|nr:SfnB family sulfur acquisition oxidoreductase [Thermomonospora echinospora]SEG54353.1 sulfur acquisition oxidoreductase, SfnB family [Thermomonospora echinospora]
MTTFDEAVAPPAAGRAHVIRTDEEAVETAARLAAEFAPGAAERDARRLLPRPQLDRLSDSGLLAITVPREYGGADVRADTLAEVYRLLAEADPNIAQIPQSHVVYLRVLAQQGDARQREYFFGEALAGRRFGNAQSEAGTRHVQDYRTRLVPDGNGGGYRLTGEKHYCTGALFAHWVPVLAQLDVPGEGDRLHVAYVPRGAPGLKVVDDWSGMGQRTTASGTVRLQDVWVPAERVVPHHLTFTGPQIHGSYAQLLHTAIDVGIAGGALREAAEFVRTKSRPWFESGVSTAAEDPLLVQRFGELAIAERSARALLAEAGRAVEVARHTLTEEATAAASIAVATAKAVADRACVEISSALFEVSGTRSSLEGLNLHRHWRNARTHTLHDPVRWKVQHIGRYTLNGTPPPRHGVI